MPPQYKAQPLYDFRNAPDETRGFKVGVTKYGKQGTKRKLEEYAGQVTSRALSSSAVTSFVAGPGCPTREKAQAGKEPVASTWWPLWSLLLCSHEMP